MKMPRHVKLTLKKDFDEWQVRVHKDGKFEDESTYFALDKDDAIDTATEMKRFYEAGGSVVELGAGLRQLEGQPQQQTNPARSKAQYRWAQMAYKKGIITKKQHKDFVDVDYDRLPERVGKKRKGAKMAKKRRRKHSRRRGRKLTKAQRRRIALRNLAKAHRGRGRRTRGRSSRRRSGGRKFRRTLRRRRNSRTPRQILKELKELERAGVPGARKQRAMYLKIRRRSGSVKRRRNFEMSSLPPAAFVREWYRVDGAKKKISSVTAASLRQRGHKVEKAAPPVRTGPRIRKRAGRRKSRKAARKHARRRSKAAIRRERLRNLKKAQRALRRKRRGKGRRAGRRKQRRHARKHRRSGRRRSAASIRRERLRNLRKARKARRLKLGRKHRKRGPRMHRGKRSVVRRAVRRVRRWRPGYSAASIRRTALRDYSNRKHRRGRNRVKRLALDTRFEMDFRRAYKTQGISRSRQRKRVRGLRRHPSHLDKRQTSYGTRRGWKEFAGYPPNTVNKFKSSPVKGTFNGVLIDEIHGYGSNSGRRIVIKPPRNAPLHLIWGSGGRSFEVVGPSNSITSLAKGMARAGEPIRITKINYFAPTYPSPAGVRRTGRERMSIAYTHPVKHRAFLTWNQKSGSRARFPIITRGTRGKSLVNRSGITV